MNSEVTIKQLKAICKFCAKTSARPSLSRPWYVASEKKLYATDSYMAFCGCVDAGEEDFTIDPDALKMYASSVKFDLSADLSFCKPLDAYGVSASSMNNLFSNARDMREKSDDSELILFDPDRIKAVSDLAKAFGCQLQFASKQEKGKPELIVLRKGRVPECRALVMPAHV